MGEPTFHIVGPASSLEFAQMEYLGEMLMRNLPNIMCRIVRVHPSDWRAYASEVCRLQGFPPELAQRLAPFAWTGAGYLVGGAADFNADVRACRAAHPHARASARPRPPAATLRARRSRRGGAHAALAAALRRASPC